MAKSKPGRISLLLESSLAIKSHSNQYWKVLTDTVNISLTILACISNGGKESKPSEVSRDANSWPNKKKQMVKICLMLLLCFLKMSCQAKNTPADGFHDYDKILKGFSEQAEDDTQPMHTK